MQPYNPADREWSEAPTAPLNPDRRYADPGSRRWPAPTNPADQTSAGYQPFVVGYNQNNPAPQRPIVPPPPPGPSWLALHGPQIIALVFGVIEGLIAIRVVLKLFAANPAAEFTGFVYGFTAPFVAPFQGVFPNPGGSASVLELSSILAVIIYALLGRLLTRVALLAAQRRTPPRSYP